MDYRRYTTNSFDRKEQDAARALIALAIQEDLNDAGDITSQLAISEDETARVAINARQAGIVCGLPVAAMVLREIDSSLKIEIETRDGTAVEAGGTIATVSGPTRELLIAERTVLNFLTHLSGIASLTNRFVQEVAGTSAAILDTRKTHPGFRLLEKYAVRCGGGQNHRVGLYDAVLIKDNHLAARKKSHPEQSPAEFLQFARKTCPDTIIEVEVDTLEQLQQMIPGNPDIILLDNMSNDLLKQAVKIRDERNPHILLEASGGVTLQTVRQIAQTNVDRISVGSLTHSAVAFDIGFDWLE